MDRFRKFNINEQLAKSFTEVFENRTETPTPKKNNELVKVIECTEKLSLVEWKNYIRAELKKFV